VIRFRHGRGFRRACELVVSSMLIAYLLAFILAAVIG
jgi:hypothetical protein